MASVAARLTLPRPVGYFNFMRRLIFAVLICGAAPAPASAQDVPGRDLLDYQLGTGGDATAIATETGEGIWNPATLLLPAGARARLGAGALVSAPEQGIDAQLLLASIALPGRTTAGISMLRASVDGLVRTETDPQSIGTEIPYSTTLVSVGVARRLRSNLVAGTAVRYRQGQLDGVRRGVAGVDAGLLLTDLGRVDGRIGIASFLFAPGEQRGATLNVSGDLRFLGSDSAHEARVGYSGSVTRGGGRDRYFVVAARSSRLSARAGVVREDDFGNPQWRARLGVGLHYARYTIVVAREENGAGLDPTYHLTLSALIR
jgi:hypothetical protein